MLTLLPRIKGVSEGEKQVFASPGCVKFMQLGSRKNMKKFY